jgi:regulator of sirC expression with transglutaminase-like and TPR domain
MVSMYARVTDLSYFRTLVADAARIPLFEAAASLAQDENPGLDLQQVLSSLDILGKGLAERCKNATTELERLKATSAYFYRELRFAGNVNDFYDPNNSFLHKVMETRRGIPISLAVIFMELAGIVGLNTEGIAFPGHFLIKVNLHQGPVVLDPFTGRSLSRDDLIERLSPYRKANSVDGEDELPIGLFLQPATPPEILLRMLRNLREIYRRVLDRTLILDPEDTAGRRLRDSLGS